MKETKKACEHFLCCDSVCDDEIVAIKVGKYRTNYELTEERTREILKHISECRECWGLVLPSMREELNLKPRFELHLVNKTNKTAVA